MHFPKERLRAENACRSAVHVLNNAIRFGIDSYLTALTHGRACRAVRSTHRRATFEPSPSHPRASTAQRIAVRAIYHPLVPSSH